MDARLYEIGKDENVVQLFSFEYCDVLGQVLFLFTILKPSDLGRCSFWVILLTLGGPSLSSVSSDIAGLAVLLQLLVNLLKQPPTHLHIIFPHVRKVYDLGFPEFMLTLD